MIILQNNYSEILAMPQPHMPDLNGHSIVSYLDHHYSVSSVISENMGHPKPIIIVIIKKCPKLLRIYGNAKINAEK